MRSVSCSQSRKDFSIEYRKPAFRHGFLCDWHACPPGQSKRHLLWNRRHNPTLALCVSLRDPKGFWRCRHLRRTLELLNPEDVKPGDVVGVGIHTGNALRGYEVGKIARERGAWVIFGGIHATLYPEEAIQLGGAHAVVKGDGDVIWGEALNDCVIEIHARFTTADASMLNSSCPRAGT